jgi:hypothetical protein
MNNVFEYLFFFFYGFESWSIVSRTGHKDLVPENKFWGKIFGTTKDEVTGE